VTSTPALSISIPAYRQMSLARSCIESILAQTWTDFALTVYDDGASDDYAQYLRSLGDPRVGYVRNPIRLGALGNMFACLRQGTGRYTMAFHEDDLMSPQYLASAIDLLESRPDLGFVCAEVHDIADLPGEGAPAVTPEPEIIDSPAAFVRAILGGVNPMFGSVIYRRAALADAVPDHAAYATLADRPFLMTIVERWSAAVIRAPLVGYRAHGPGDRDPRHDAMTVDHIVRLFTTYRSRLPEQMNDEDRRLFYSFTGYWLFVLYDLVPATQRPTLAAYLRRVRREGLYEPGWRGRWGLRLQLRAALGARSSGQS